MTSRLPLALLALGFPLLLVSWWLPAPVGSWLLVGLNAVLPMALVALALPRRDGLAALRAGLTAAALLLALALGAILSTRGGREAVLAGLPAGALWLLVGLWLVPLLAISTLYALTFDRFAAGDRELDELRREGRAEPPAESADEPDEPAMRGGRR